MKAATSLNNEVFGPRRT